MSHQTPITNFFKLKGRSTPMDKTTKNRKLSLSLKKPIKTEKIHKDVVIISSEDEEISFKESPAAETLHSAEDGLSSASSSQTILYSLSPHSPKRQKTTPPKILSTSTSPLSRTRPSPCSNSKYYSPNKKRSVHLKSPKKGKRNLALEFEFEEPEADVQNHDATYLKACEGQDDKTKFLLNIINDFLKDESLRNLLDIQSQTLLSNIFLIPTQAMRLICRLYWRKEGWYRREQLSDIGTEGKNETLDDPTTTLVLNSLVENHFFDLGNSKTVTFNDFTSILKADELKGICKDLKIKTQSKKSAIESLQEFCKKSSISSYFGNSNILNNSQRILQIMSQKAGACYRLSEKTRGVLDRLYLIMYLGIDYDIIRENRLELMLINEKIGRETFPVDKNMRLDNASLVFQDKDEFERYYVALKLHEDFISCQDVDEKCRLVEQVYTLYRDMDPIDIVKYKSLPQHLERFTPAYKYVKILEEGVQELKRGKNGARCVLADEVLRTLAGQTVRVHRRADWIAERALVLHTYLNKPEEAAQVLLAGFTSGLAEDACDLLRPRARKLALQKNVNLDECVREQLLAHADKEYLLEANIPCQHFYKQPMENITKGKALFETRHENGRVVQSVEEYALSCYLLAGDYTHGGHWEGRIITTIFFLLFWDIIYSQPKDVPGVFLSHYQQYPLDMFCEDFYFNRREAIENRLSVIEKCSAAEIVEIITIELENRPESELSGVCRDISSVALCGVASSLSGKGLVALCGRLARRPRTRSGFPDLTLYHPQRQLIKFVEVKSDNDKPSVKQIQWLQFLRSVGVDAEFCYVGAHTDKPKSRQRLHKTPTKSPKKSPRKRPLSTKKNAKIKE